MLTKLIGFYSNFKTIFHKLFGKQLMYLTHDHPHSGMLTVDALNT